jgi:hypothetical protein
MKLVPGYEYSLNLTLDLRVSLESVLIQRLKQQPSSRHQEWLRRLLVLGFSEECKSLQRSAGQTIQPSSDMAFVALLSRESDVGNAAAVRQEQPVSTIPQGRHKPLAALQKVLGEKVA